jgi:hypothetical protein
LNDINAQAARLRSQLQGAQRYADGNNRAARISQAAAQARRVRGIGLLGARDKNGKLRDRTRKVGTGRFALSNG